MEFKVHHSAPPTMSGEDDIVEAASLTLQAHEQLCHRVSDWDGSNGGTPHDGE
jgi:hypothetical protein